MINYLKINLFLLLTIFSLSSYAEIFTVTSNADSGLGTLREALQKAADNGNLEKDFIYFNLPDLSEVGRTILIMTQLPKITSDLVIDGITQPGNKFGMSDAKVCIKAGIFPANLDGLVFSGNNISAEVYGLVISNFLGTRALYGFLSFNSGINFETPGKFIVGAPGKGNVIIGCYNGIRGPIANSKIQSNFIGLSVDGTTSSKNEIGISCANSDIKNSLIGGNSKNEGNVIDANVGGIIFYGQYNYSPNDRVDIINNSFGTDANETIDLNDNKTYTNYHISVDQTINILVKKNVFSGGQTAIKGQYMKMQMYGNFFGTDRLQKIKLGKGGFSAIQGTDRDYLTIGGENDEDQNVFTNYGQAISLSNFSRAKVIKNSFYCDQLINIGYPYLLNFQPIFKILNLTDTKVSGTSFSNSLIQLYYSENSCGNCNPKERFASVMSDASGRWEYDGNITGPILVSTTSGEETFGFEPISIQKDEVTIKDFYCNQKGSIEIKTKRQGNFVFLWKDSNGKLVSDKQLADNLDPGNYYLDYGIKGGCLQRSVFTIQNRIPQAYTSSHNLPCSLKEITFSSSNYNINITPNVDTYYYEDLLGNIISMKNSSLITLSVGQYFFYIKDINGCVSNKALVTISSVKETPKIDESSIIITNVTCNKTDGSIKNLKFEDDGSVFFRWYDEKNKIVAFTKDLINKGTGKYRLELSRNFGCMTEVSSTFEIKEINGISSDQTSLKINASNCNKSNGSISGLNISGATKYQWFNEANQIVGDKVELLNQPAGKYKLTANNQNCTKDFGPFSIDLVPPKNYGIPDNIVLNPSCGEVNGSIEVNFKISILPSKYDWRKIGGASLNINANKITNLSVGKYSLFLIDENGCEQFINTYEVKEGKPAMSLVDKSWKTVADNCGTSSGGVNEIRFNYENETNKFSWFNDKGDLVSSEKDLKNAKTGNYRLIIKNQYCGNYFDFYIPYKEDFLPKALINDIFICAPTQVNINVKEDGDSYLIYDEYGKVISQSTSKQIIFNAKENQKLAITYKIGNCESEKAYFNINIGASSVAVPSAFTPNGDGVNDVWVIKGLELYVKAKVSIFNRFGQEVFKHSGGLLSFDGTINGIKLQTGTYYYIIKLSEDCSPISGSVMILN